MGELYSEGMIAMESVKDLRKEVERLKQLNEGLQSAMTEIVQQQVESLEKNHLREIESLEEFRQRELKSIDTIFELKDQLEVAMAQVRALQEDRGCPKCTKAMITRTCYGPHRMCDCECHSVEGVGDAMR